MDEEKGFLGDKLGGFRPEPNPEVWAALENELNKRRKKRPWLIFWLLGGLILFSGLVFWGQIENKINTQLAQKIEQTDRVQTGGLEKKQAKIGDEEIEKPIQHKNSISAEDIKAFSTAEDEKIEESKHENKSTSSFKSEKKKSGIATGKKRNWEGKTGNTLKQKRGGVLAVKVENEITSLNPVGEKSSQKPKIELQNNAENVNALSKENNDEIVFGEKANSRTDKAIDSIARSLAVSISDSTKSFTPIVENKDSTDAKKKPWKFSVGATGFYTLHRSWRLNEGQENRISLNKPSQAWRSRMAVEISGKADKIIYKHFTGTCMAGFGYAAEEIAYLEKGGIQGYDQHFDAANNHVLVQPHYSTSQIRIRQNMLFAHVAVGIGWENELLHFTALAGSMMPVWASGAVEKPTFFNLYFQGQVSIKASKRLEVVPQLRWNPKPIFSYQNRSSHKPLHLGIGLLRSF